MTINLLLGQEVQRLKENNIKEPIQKARIILAKMLNKDKEFLIMNAQQEIPKELEIKFIKNINRLIENEPLQYITKNQEFMKLNFFVNSDVLIPQPDTEILVEEVIKISEDIDKLKILDLCTGSGAIAVSLKKYIENSRVVATDISERALEIAAKNAKDNNVEIEFIKSNLFRDVNTKFNIIVSNPPYIKTSVIETLEKEVQKEPIIALNGGIDGLDFYRSIINEADKYLNINGFLCLEIGYDQKNEVIRNA